MDELELVEYLARKEFDKIFEGEELHEFGRFIKERGVPSKGFVVTAPVIGERKDRVWFLYHLRDTYIELYNREGVKGDRLIIGIESVEVYVPQDGNRTEPPARFHGYPVWKMSIDY